MKTTRINRLELCVLLAAGLITACDADSSIPYDPPKPDNGGPILRLDWGLGNRDAQVCGLISRIPELPPFDMMLALDTSYSMDFKEKWINIKSALKLFAQDDSFSSMGVGAQYFPLRAQCKVTDYEAPAVAIRPIKQVASELSGSLDSQRMSGGTPMVPLLQGTLDYARKWATDHPERNVSIILATDGIPDDTCLTGNMPNTLNNVIQIATDAATNRPRIPIFVIGVGTELTALDQIAKAGGSNKAFLLDTKDNIQKAFLEALNEIRRTMACEYDVPPPPSSEVRLDYKNVLVKLTLNGKAELFDPVTGQADCATTKNGWYFDDPLDPKKLVLCEESCKKSHSEGGKIDVFFGCESVPD
jgi:hypothetical protein